MTKRLSFIPLVSLVAFAIALSGCGSSSNGGTTPGSTAASAPGSTTGAPSGSGITASTSLSSATGLSALVTAIRQKDHGVSSTGAYTAARCAVKLLAKEGISTIGELNQHRAEAYAAGVTCGREVKSGSS